MTATASAFLSFGNAEANSNIGVMIANLRSDFNQVGMVHYSTRRSVQQHFVSAYNVRRHTSMVHRNDRPFRCTKCTHIYSTKYNLLSHMNAHQNDAFENCTQAAAASSSSRTAGAAVESESSSMSSEEEEEEESSDVENRPPPSKVLHSLYGRV